MRPNKAPQPRSWLIFDVWQNEQIALHAVYLCVKAIALVCALLVALSTATGAVDPSKMSPPADKVQRSATEVFIVSDGICWVSIKGVLRPTKGESIRLELAPGEYEVIARRKEYRDVTKTLKIEQGINPRPLAMFCNTPL